MLSTKAYVNPEIECIHVSDLDLVLSFGAIFFTNLIVLICWTTISPLQWDREYSSSTDTFGRPNETYARCTSDNEAVYWSLLAAFNLGVLVLCNWWAYRSRNIETEYNESSFVGVSAAAVLQAWAMGIPIIIVVVSDSPQAAFYVATGIVFVTAQALISLIYIPKVIALRKARKEELEKRKLESFRAHKNSGSKGGDDDEHDENGERHHDGRSYWAYRRGRRDSVYHSHVNGSFA
jgi:7 transmembrane sweet-taste receptor of 3 GCPR